MHWIDKEQEEFLMELEFKSDMMVIHCRLMAQEMLEFDYTMDEVITAMLSVSFIGLSNIGEDPERVLRIMNSKWFELYRDAYEYGITLFLKQGDITEDNAGKFLMKISKAIKMEHLERDTAKMN